MPASILAGAVLAGPVALASLAVVPRALADRHPAAMGRAAVVAAAVSLAGGLAAASAVPLAGPVTAGLPTVTLAGVSMSLGLRLDALSSAMLVLVAVIGLAVLAFSRNGLAGDPGHGRFIGALSGTLACVLVFVASGGLLTLGLAWVAASLMLHRLLVFYPQRRRAVACATKKFVVARLSDVCLLAAIVLTGSVFGTLDFDRLLPAAAALRDADTIHPGVPAIATALACAALLKSAQVPVHGWLTETVETPTPVSALLHAGIVNAGGYLLLRLSDLLVLSPGALGFVAAAGALTALTASLAMLPQTGIKVAIAWSTVAQMGFMMLQIGLGSFVGAFLHIVGHALYKAHAFLGSGEVLAERRARLVTPAGRAPRPALVAGMAGAALAMALAASLVAGGSAGVMLFTATLLISLSPMLASAVANRSRPALALPLAGLAGAAALALLLQTALAHMTMGATLPATTSSGVAAWLLAAGVAVAFASLVVLQAAASEVAARPAFQALFVHALNGFGLNAAADRLLRLARA